MPRHDLPLALHARCAGCSACHTHLELGRVSLHLCVLPAVQEDDPDEEGGGEFNPKCEQCSWPYLYSCSVVPWGLVLFGHRKELETKVRMVLLQPGEPAIAADQTEDEFIPSLPAGSKGENFVLGMALDCSCQVRTGCSSLLCPCLVWKVASGRYTPVAACLLVCHMGCCG